MTRDLRRTTPATAAARTDGTTSLLLFFTMIAAFVAVLAFAGNAGAVTRTGGTGTDPWVSSELPDYAPGSTVNLLGGSWQPGESVHIYVNDSAGQTWVFNDDVSADTNGDISDTFSLPNWFVANYSVTATGASGAVATSTFTDSQPQAVTVGGPTSVTVTQGNTASFGTVNVQVGGNASNCTMTLSTSTLAGDTGLPTGATPSFGNSPVTTMVNFTSSLSVATTASVAPGTYTFHVRVSRGVNCQGNGTIDSTQQLSLTITSACIAASVSTSPANQTITYGANATFTASAAGSPAPTVQWQVDSGSGFTNLSGQTTTTLALTRPTVSMSGNKYRAVFTNTCSGTQTATTTAATLTVNRKPIAITPVSGQSKVYGDADPTLTYASAPALESGDSFTGALGRVAGEDAGSYSIALGSLSAGDNYSLSISTPAVSFAITKAPLTVTADSKSRSYGDANPTFTASYSGFKRGETLATSGVAGNPSLMTAATASSGVGSYTITAGLGTLSSNNYSFNFANGTLAIGTATLSVNAGDKTKTYGDTDPVAGYALSGFKNSEDATSAGVAGAASCSIGGHSENAGTYDDVYSCGPGSLAAANYDFVAGSKGKLTINKKAASVTAEDKTKVYGSDDPALTTTNSGFLAGDLGAGKISFSTTRVSGESVAGSPYTITPSASEGASNLLDNYDVTYTNGQLTISKRAASVTAEDKTKVYGADDPALTTTQSGFLAGDLGAGKISFSTTRASGESVAASPYTITPSALDGATNLLGNYDVTYNPGQLTITKKAASVTAEDRTKVYGSDDPALTTTDSGFLASDLGAGKISFSANRAAGESVAGSPYTITPAASDGVSNLLGNYEVTYNPGQLTISKKPASVTAEDKTKVYGSDDPALTTTDSGFLASDLGAGKITFSASRAAGESVAGGPYSITPSASDGATNLLSNYEVSFNTGQLTITKKAASVSAEDNTKVYGSDDPALTTTSSGFLAADLGVGKITFSAAREAGETVAGGPYSITPSASDAGSNMLDNYDVTYNSGQFTITKKAASVTAEDKTKVYGSDDPALATTDSGFVAADLGAGKITFSASRAAGESVAGGPYSITPSASDGATNLLSNYEVSFNTGQLTITKKAASVSAEDNTKVYGSDDPALTTTSSGFLAADLGSDKISFSASRAPGESVAGGPYTISPSASDGASNLLGNYEITYNSGQLTITKKAASVTAEDKTKVYGSDDPALTTTSGGFLASDLGAGKITFSASRAAGESVAGGPYTITPAASDGASNLLSNYDVSSNTGRLTISKKAASVSAEDKSKVYGDPDPALTTTQSGFLAGDLGAGKISFSTNRAAGESVAGSPYTITPAASDGVSNLLGNYEVTYNTGQLTITKKAASVTAQDKSKVYGSDDLALTTTSSGFLAADLGVGKITFSATRASGESVAGGPYAITPAASDGASNLLGNYDVTYNSGQLTISKRPLTVTADNKSKTYDGNPFSGGFTRTISGFAFGETDSVVSGSVVFGGPATTAVDAGNYVITADVSGLSAANYSFSTASVNSGNLTINQRPITITADAKTKVFGTSDPALTYGLTAGSLVAGDSLSGSLVRNPGELVGAYAIKRGGVTAGPNYAITYVGANLVITAWNAAGKGFYAPVGADATHSIFTPAPGTAPTTKPGSMVWNTIKGGQTVPLKFNVFAGAVEKTTSDAFPSSDVTKAFQMQKLANCTDSVDTDPIDYTATSGQTVLRYDPSGMQWIQNWATPKVSATTCYRTFVTFADGSTIEAFFQLTK